MPTMIVSGIGSGRDFGPNQLRRACRRFFGPYIVGDLSTRRVAFCRASRSSLAALAGCLFRFATERSKSVREPAMPLPHPRASAWIDEVQMAVPGNPRRGYDNFMKSLIRPWGSNSGAKLRRRHRPALVGDRR